MASSVTYNIKGKYDNKGMKSALNDFKQLGTIVKGLAVVKVAQQLNKVAQATKGVFIEQNKALTNFNTAVAKSNIQLSKLQNLQTKISHGNFFDADTINNAMALGLQMGLNEEQLNKVMTASSELASAGVMPLEQAVKTLSQSYTGQSTQLSKLIPDIKNLTKEELENGDAVDVVISKYNGYADAMSSTFSGRSTQWKNSLADLKASIGSIPTSLEFLMQGKLMESLNKITEWIVKNRDYIINFFIQLPSIASTVFNKIKEMGTKTIENLPQIITELAPLIIQMAKDAFTRFFEVAKASIQGIKDLLDWAIGNPFRNSRDFVNSMLNNIIEGINDLPQHLPKWAKKVFGVDEKSELIKFRFDTNSGDKNNSFDATAKKITESIKKAGDAYKDGTQKVKDDWLAILNQTTGFYKDDVKELQGDLAKILGTELPADLRKALAGTTYTPSAFDAGNNDGLGGGGDDNKNTTRDSILGNLGEIGSLIKSYLDGGWQAVIIELLSKISGIMSSASEIISNALNVVTNFLNQILPPVIKLLESVLAPMLSFMTMIGEILRDVFRVIEPVMSFIGSTAIKIVLSTVITILDLIYNSVVGIHNLFTSSKNDWAYRDMAGDVKGIWETSSAFDSSTAITASNASSSYSQARDIYVNIYYNYSYVNGDARQIALNLRDEIRSAEAMGY